MENRLNLAGATNIFFLAVQIITTQETNVWYRNIEACQVCGHGIERVEKKVFEVKRLRVALDQGVETFTSERKELRSWTETNNCVKVPPRPAWPEWWVS